MKQGILLLVLLWLCSGCSQLFAPREASRFVQDNVERLRSGDHDSFLSHLSPELRPMVNDELMQEVTGHFYLGDLLDLSLVNWSLSQSGTSKVYHLQFHYQFSTGWNLVNAKVGSTDSGLVIQSLFVHRIEAPTSPTFEIRHQTPLHYYVLVLAFACLVFIIISLVFCVRTPMPKQKFFWLLFIAMGLGGIRFDWATGELAFQFLGVHLMGVSAFAMGPSASWVITIGWPVGATAFWFKRDKWLALAASQKAANGADCENGSQSSSIDTSLSQNNLQKIDKD